MSVKLNEKFIRDFVSEKEISDVYDRVQAAHQTLTEGSGLGSDFLGWLSLPTDYDKEEFARIKAAAARIREQSDVLLVVGIGGSYLGIRAAIEFLQSPFYNSLEKDTPSIYYVGNSFSAQNLQEILALCEGKDVSINVISKSGTTTEPAIAFRLLRDYLINRYGKEEASRRIYATTDAARGTLKTLADAEGYESFVIPDNVGGRFSVLTPVGLLPIAAAGIDIDALMQGAARAQQELAVCSPENPCYRYAAIRNILHEKGKAVELLACYEPCFAMMAEWFKQLFGESEGKEGKGLFPASVIYSTDLHSLGQFVQEGSPILFETVVDIKKPRYDLTLTAAEDNGDGLNFLAGRNLSDVARKAMEGTILAHTSGGVANLVVEVEEISAGALGYLFYFFEKACAISGYMLGVNPFDQPGVESYKKNMFALLGKPGYEAEQARLLALLAE